MRQSTIEHLKTSSVPQTEERPERYAAARILMHIHPDEAVVPISKDNPIWTLHHAIKAQDPFQVAKPRVRTVGHVRATYALGFSNDPEKLWYAIEAANLQRRLQGALGRRAILRSGGPDQYDQQLNLAPPLRATFARDAQKVLETLNARPQTKFGHILELGAPENAEQGRATIEAYNNDDLTGVYIMLSETVVIDYDGIIVPPDNSRELLV